MRSITILSGIAILTLSATAAGAQPNAGQAPPETAASPAPDQDVSGDNAGASKMKSGAPDQAAAKADKKGYNEKAGDGEDKAKRPRVRPGFAQFNDQTSGNQSGNLVPYGPPR